MSDTRKRPRWTMSGPCYVDGWYMVENRAAEIPLLTVKWFETRAHARAYRRAMQAGNWRLARRINKDYLERPRPSALRALRALPPEPTP